MSFWVNTPKVILTAGIATILIEVFLHEIFIASLRSPADFYTFFFMVLSISGILATAVIKFLHIQTKLSDFITDLAAYAIATISTSYLLKFFFAEVLIEAAPVDFFLNLLACLFMSLLIGYLVIAIIVYKERRKVKNSVG